MGSLSSVLAKMKEKFRAAGIESWDADARLLVQHAMNLSREELLLQGERAVTAQEEEKLEALAARRLKREPVSRILGRRAFWKADFAISPGTLDPRADSETLIEAALRHVKNARDILDLGTGSGCLLLSLLQEWPQARGLGVDINPDAVETAKRNARALGLESRADFLTSDWNALRAEKTFDVVISNPPYIAESEIPGLEPEVTLYDPLQALAGGEDGLDCYRAILRLLPGLLKPSGYLLFEIGSSQGRPVKDLLEQAGLTVVETAIDLAGNDRCIVARYS